MAAVFFTEDAELGGIGPVILDIRGQNLQSVEYSCCRIADGRPLIFTPDTTLAASAVELAVTNSARGRFSCKRSDTGLKPGGVR